MARPSTLIYISSIRSYKDQDDPSMYSNTSEKGAIRRVFKELCGWVWGRSVFSSNQIATEIYEAYSSELPTTQNEFRQWFNKLQRELFPKRFPRVYHYHNDSWDDCESLIFWDIRTQRVMIDDDSDDDDE